MASAIVRGGERCVEALTPPLMVVEGTDTGISFVLNWKETNHQSFKYHVTAADPEAHPIFDFLANHLSMADSHGDYILVREWLLNNDFTLMMEDFNLDQGPCVVFETLATADMNRLKQVDHPNFSWCQDTYFGTISLELTFFTDEIHIQLQFVSSTVPLGGAVQHRTIFRDPLWFSYIKFH